MGATYITPVEVTPSSASAWVDVDCSTLIASGATGVILHIVSTSGTPALGIRKNGSTDNRFNIFSLGNTHHWAAIGVDASRIFEAYVGSITAIDIYIVGYFDTDAVFFTNAPDKSLSATAAWTDIDMSGDTGADTAIGAFFEVLNDGNAWNFGFRKNGSTDDRYYWNYNHFFACIGVDGSEICEGKIASTTVDFFLNGYLKAGAVFNTNATNISLGSTGVWTDLAALPSGAVGGIIEVFGTTNYTYGLRKNGSSEVILQGTRVHCWGMPECDASQLIEGYIADVDTDFFLIGYFIPSIISGLSRARIVNAGGV